MMADRFVLTLINKRIVNKSHFDFMDTGAVMLSKSGRSVLLQHWQQHKYETITHPYLKEKVLWGLVPHVQAQLLSRHLRGDMDAYPPFLWK